MIGLMIVTGDYTEYYYIDGDNYRKIKRVNARIPGKTERGGQSQNRIQRLRDEMENSYLKLVSELSRDIFENKVKSLVLMGPAHKKVIVQKKLYSNIQKLIKNVVNIQGNENIRDLIEMAKNLSEEKKEESPWVRKFFMDIEKCEGKAVYGDKEVKELLEDGMLEVVIMKEKDKYIEDIAENMGCKVVYSKNNKIFEFGNIIGLRWYTNNSS